MFCCHPSRDPMNVPVAKVISSCRAAMLDIAIHKESKRIHLVSKEMKKINFWRRIFFVKKLTFDEVAKQISVDDNICQVCEKRNDRYAQLIAMAELAERWEMKEMLVSMEDFNYFASWYY